MSLSKKRTRRGVIGIESAIVMIAFVIVAAALAFVVLNMGFSTTQKAKAAITSSIVESSSALEIAGKVTGVGHVSAGTLNATVVPIKIAGGGDAVNLEPTTTSIKYYSNTVTYDNIFDTNCILTGTTYNTISSALNAAVTAGCISSNPTGSGSAPSNTKAVLYWGVTNSPQNKILDQGEHANLAVVYKSADRPTALEKAKIEIITATGSALTIERTIPAVTTKVVDLG